MSKQVLLTRQQLQAWQSEWTAREWQPFRAAWLRRWATPPTSRQRELLWHIADARPNDLGRWIDAAPPRCSPSEAIDYVLRKWHALAGEIGQLEQERDWRYVRTDEAPRVLRDILARLGEAS